MPLGILKIITELAEKDKALALTPEQVKIYFKIDGEEDVATRLLESTEANMGDASKEVLREYERLNVRFSRHGRCFYTNVDSESSISLCRRVGEYLERELRDFDVYVAACRRDNCLFMHIPSGYAFLNLLIVGEGDRTKIYVSSENASKVLEDLFRKEGVEVRRVSDGYEVVVNRGFDSVIEKLKRYAKLMREAVVEPRKFEDRIWKLLEREVLSRLTV